jgi:hypothetical protein
MKGGGKGLEEGRMDEGGGGEGLEEGRKQVRMGGRKGLKEGSKSLEEGRRDEGGGTRVPSWRRWSSASLRAAG